MISFQEVILRLQDYWNKQGCALLQTSRGAPAMPSPAGGLPTAATARTRTAFISITSSRLS